mgnify:CR=1 FL=1
MNRLIKNNLIAAAIVSIVELLSIIATVLCYVFLRDFQYYVFVAFGFALLMIIFQFVFFLKFSKQLSNLRKRTDLKVADIIGNDVQEAYYFGKIGLMITDDDYYIIWTSEFLENHNIDFVDKKITEVFPSLRQFLLSLKDNDGSTKVSFQNHTFEVKVIKDTNLFMFKDVTEYESLFEYSNEQAPVVGLVNLDNYADILSSVEDNKISDMTMTVKKMITSYFTDHHIMIRSVKDDTYLIVTSKKNFDEIYNDKFSVIDKVRNAYDDGFTLSIGISYGFPDYSELMELASNAIDVALSRGGDQVIIAPFSESMEFIGGKSEARVSRNKVKIRTISQSLLTLISHSSNVLIMGHINADFDAMGAALGIRAMANHVNIDSRIIFEDQFIEKKVRRALKSIFTPKEMASMFVNFKGAHDFYNPRTLVIIVDCSNPALFLYDKILDDNSRVAVIDHHRRSENFSSNILFNCVDPSASSTCELVAEFISYNHAKIDLEEKYATLMLCGILLDTNYYRLKTSVSTYDASSILKSFGADNEKADDFLKEDYEEYALKNKIMANTITPYYGVIVCISDENDIVDSTMLAIVAREALMIRGVNACFVIGKTAVNEVKISSRSDGTINCQLLLEKLGGGGHFTAAATNVLDKSLSEVKDSLLHVLHMYLDQARNEGGK